MIGRFLVFNRPKSPTLKVRLVLLALSTSSAFPGLVLGFHVLNALGLDGPWRTSRRILRLLVDPEPRSLCIGEQSDCIPFKRGELS